MLVVIPGEEALERMRRKSIKANYSLMSLPRVIKSRDAGLSRTRGLTDKTKQTKTKTIIHKC